MVILYDYDLYLFIKIILYFLGRLETICLKKFFYYNIFWLFLAMCVKVQFCNMKTQKRKTQTNKTFQLFQKVSVHFSQFNLALKLSFDISNYFLLKL